MAKKRRLGDLFVVGGPFVITDPKGSVEVWLQKPSEIDDESILRRSNARKARFIRDADDLDSELYLSEYASVRSFGVREVLVGLAISEDLLRARARITAETQAEDEWSEEGYFQGLIDAWNGDPEDASNLGGLMAVWAAGEDQDDPRWAEAVATQGALERFSNQVENQVDAEETRLRRDWGEGQDDYEITPQLDAKLYDIVTRHMVQRTGEELFFTEYVRQQLYYSVREFDNHGQRYFSDVSEIDDLDHDVKLALSGALNALIVPADEGKDSEGITASSPSSEQPETEAESTSSGPEVAAA